MKEKSGGDQINLNNSLDFAKLLNNGEFMDIGFKGPKINLDQHEAHKWTDLIG